MSITLKDQKHAFRGIRSGEFSVVQNTLKLKLKSMSDGESMNTLKIPTIFRAGICALTLISTTATLGTSLEGFTEPYRKIDVAAAETGTVSKLLVREGDRIVKGQALAMLDKDVLEVYKEIAEANTQVKGKSDSAEAERNLRKIRLERLEPLREQGHASQEEIDRARTELQVAEANLRSVREQRLVDALELKKVEAMIERRTLRSPIDGVVTKLHKDEQEFVSNNSATVVTVVQLDPLRVIFTIPTKSALSIEAGQTVALEFPESNNTAPCKVEFVAPITEAESGTVRVKVLLDNPKGQYRCGVRCSLNLQNISKDENALKSVSTGLSQ
jgi:RND family efflux transporter MFP subunit